MTLIKALQVKIPASLDYGYISDIPLLGKPSRDKCDKELLSLIPHLESAWVRSDNRLKEVRENPSHL